MGGLSIGLIIALGVVVLIIFAVIGIYNGLVTSRNQMKNAWSQIDVQLKRRHDLIPNLVETVRGYATHERGALEGVVAARAKATGAATMNDRMQAESMLTGALGRLLAVVEQYPDLKANQNFLSLQEELSSTENKIGFSRQFYNDSVMRYNTKTETFPANVIAGMFRFERGTFFEIQNQNEREVPKVKF